MFMDELELEGIFDETDIPANLSEEENLNLGIAATIDAANDIEDDFFTIGEQNSDPLEHNTLIEEFLKYRGIEDGRIKIIDENEEEKEVNFYDLTKEEQLEILGSAEEPENNDLLDEEIDFLNMMRTNNLSPEQFLEQYKQSILSEMQSQGEPFYEIDNYDDQELFLLDLKNKYDLTDEELQIELEKELAHPEVFNKKIGVLRNEYKESEDEFHKTKQQEAKDFEDLQYNQFTQVLDNIASKVDHFHGVYLENDEKYETLSYLLDLDDSGVSRFSKELDDPNKLFEAAWYLRYGKEAFAALESAYEAEIARLKEPDKPRVVVRDSKNPIKHINELY